MSNQEYVIYSKRGGGYWNGARWSSKSDAKTFVSQDAAKREMDEAKMEWMYNILSKKK